MINDTPNELMKLAEEKLAELYALPKNYRISPLKYSENVIFKVEADGTEPMVFRMRRPAYHTDEEIRGELTWIDELTSSTDIAMPTIFKGRNGSLLQLIKSEKSDTLYRCDMMSFLKGHEVGSLAGEQLEAVVAEIGGITAKMHLQSMHRDKSIPIERFSWNEETIFGDNPHWGKWSAYSEIRGKDTPLLEKAEQLIRQRLADFGRSEETYGLIHADLHFNNVIENNGVLQIFDFDDCGYGYYLYDVGCTLVTCSEKLERLVECWTEGYERFRRLSGREKSMLMTFVLLRRIVRFAWFASHSDSDTIKTVDAGYYDKTIEMAQQLVEGRL